MLLLCMAFRASWRGLVGYVLLCVKRGSRGGSKRGGGGGGQDSASGRRKFGERRGLCVKGKRVWSE